MLTLITCYTQAQNPNTHLDIESTDKGILIPRMDSSVRNAIVPNLNEESLLVYDNDLKKFMFWDGDKWSQIGNKEQYVFSEEGNVFVGVETGQNITPNYVNTEGFYNTSIGHQTGKSLSTGRGNSLYGAGAGFAFKHGQDNVFIGSNAGGLVDTSDLLTFVGSYSGFNNNGENNSFFGAYSGNSNKSGHGNTFLGTNSGKVNISGTNNTFTGINAGSTNQNGSFNTYIGQYSGYENVTGGRNTFLGGGAGRKQEGSYNTMIGFNSGYAKAIGNQNLNYSVFIGQRAGENITESNQLVIEPIDQSFPLIRGDFQLNTLDLNAFVKIHELLRIKPSTVSYVCTDLLEGTLQYLNSKLQVCTVDNSGSTPLYEWQPMH